MPRPPKPNPAAGGIARDFGAHQIIGLSPTKQLKVQRMLARALKEGWTDARLASELAPVVGLDQRRQIARQALLQRLQAAGVPPWKQRRLVGAYERRALKSRARTIARTEKTGAKRESDRRAWQRDQANGELGAGTVRVSRINPQGTACPTCRAQDGVRRSVAGVFGGPPYHPNCQCTEELVDQTILKHLPGMHDQKTHGHGGLFGLFPTAKPLGNGTLRSEVRGDLEHVSAGDPHGPSGGFASAILALADAFPAVADNLNAVKFSPNDPTGHLAYATTRPNGWFMVADPEKIASHASTVNWGAEDDRGRPNNIGLDLARNEDGTLDPHRLGSLIAIHEFGHLMQYHANLTSHLLGRSEQGEAQRAPLSVSQYGDTNVREGYAEWFTQWWTEGMPSGPFVVRQKALWRMGLEMGYNGKRLKKMADEVILCEGSFVPKKTRKRPAAVEKAMNTISPGGRPADKSNLAKPGYKGPKRIPNYGRMVAHALMRKGMPKGRAIGMARGILKNWASGQGEVSAKVRAAAVKALAEWAMLDKKASVSKAEQSTWDFDQYQEIVKQLREDEAL